MDTLPLNTDTVFENTQGDDDIVITIRPALFTPNTVGVRLNIDEHYYVVNNKYINAGELCMLLKNHQLDIDFTIEEKRGELIVSGEDAKHYHIDDEGNLIYTYK